MKTLKIKVIEFHIIGQVGNNIALQVCMVYNADNGITFFYIKSRDISRPTYFVSFKSKKELNYHRFVDTNIVGASRIYEFVEFCSFSSIELPPCLNKGLNPEKTRRYPMPV